MVTRTQRGFHLYFRYKPIGNSVKVGGREMDIRGDGGYVVAPPSIHPDTGMIYSWEDGPVPPSALPEMPMELLQKTQQLTRVRVRNVGAYLAKIESVQGQNGSAGLVRAVSVCRDAGLTEAQTMVELFQWNSSAAVNPPWSGEALARAVDRVFRKVTA